MSLMAPRRHADDGQAAIVNDELASELSALAAKEFTGALEVLDRGTRNRARLFLYDGGLYAIDLDGYPRAVFARLQTSGIFETRSTTELVALAGLDVPDPAAITHAVESGWLTIDALANVHQELLLASLGAVLALPKAKTRPRKGQTSAEFCTLPLPIDPLFDTVRMRADRLQGTWAMLAPGTAPGQAVLSRTLMPLDRTALTPEVAALANAVDGARSLDVIAYVLGLTRAEVVHVASVLVRSGMARVEVDAPDAAEPEHCLVPESFGSHRVVPVVPERLPALKQKPTKPVLVEVPVAAATESLPMATPASLPTSLPLRPVGDVDERERGLESARADVARLHHELQACVRAEQEAINATAEVSQRLRDARVILATLEMTESVGLA